MKRIMVKTVILISLIALSLYQTTLLWFDYPSNRNFFYSFMGNVDGGTTKNSILDAKIFAPQDIGVYDGTNAYTYKVVNATNPAIDEYLNDINRLLTQLYKSGIRETGYVNKSDIFEQPHILFRMPFLIDKNMMVGDNNYQTPLNMDEFVFDQIYIMRPALGNENIYIYFENTDKSLVVRTFLPLANNEELVAILEQDIQEMTSTDLPKFLASDQVGLQAFQNNILLALDESIGPIQSEIQLEKAFIKEGDINVEKLMAYVTGFFTEADLWKLVNNDMVRFGGRNAKIEYSSKGIVHYEDIRATTATVGNFRSSLLVAEKFIEKDSEIGGIEYRLHSYKVKDGEYTFYFAYYYRDYVLYIGENDSLFDYSYPMQISVKGNRVTKYVRLLWKEQEILSQGEERSINYTEAIDRYFSQAEGDEMVHDVNLAYYFPNIESTGTFEWIFEGENHRIQRISVE